MAPLILQILSGIQLALQLAQEAKPIYDNAKLTFDMLAAGGLITVAQQSELKSWAEAHEAATLAGQVAPELVVDPDPV